MEGFKCGGEEGEAVRHHRQPQWTGYANFLRFAPGSWEQREKRPGRKEKGEQKRYCSVAEGSIYEKGWVLRVPTVGPNCTGRLLWFIGLLRILRKKSSARVVYGFLSTFGYLCSVSRWRTSLEKDTILSNYRLGNISIYLFFFLIFEIYIREEKNTYVILRQMLILEDLFLCSTVSSLVIIDRMIVLKRW